VKKFGRITKISIVLLTLLLIWILFAPFLAERLIVEKSLEKADAILILGGSATYLERTQKATELYKNGVAPKIFLTDDGERGSWNAKEQKNPKFAELAQKRLIEQGISPENIEILQPEVSGTIDEAQVLANKARENNLKNVIIVTSAYHTRRALWTFERKFEQENLSVNFGIFAPPAGIQTPPPQIWWLSPRGWQFVAGEYLKSLYYSVFY
jgi:uncharacterized SAM-binding protein YcdF (DUF218 family)